MKIDLHAIFLLIPSWLILAGMFSAYQPSEDFINSHVIIAAFIYLWCMCPICFGSNKSKFNTIFIVCANTTVLLLFTILREKTGIVDFFKIMAITSPIMIALTVTFNKIFSDPET
jgi:hypothetical protein